MHEEIQYATNAEVNSFGVAWVIQRPNFSANILNSLEDNISLGQVCKQTIKEYPMLGAAGMPAALV